MPRALFKVGPIAWTVMAGVPKVREYVTLLAYERSVSMSPWAYEAMGTRAQEAHDNDHRIVSNSAMLWRQFRGDARFRPNLYRLAAGMGMSEEDYNEAFGRDIFPRIRK